MTLDPGRPQGRRVISEIEREKFLRLISAGVTITAATQALGFSPSHVQTWVKNDPVFAERYRRARMLQADALVDSMVEIAQRPAGDMAAVQRNKLEIDTYKWVAAKLAPRRYGEKLQADHTHTVGVVLLPALDVAQKAIKEVANGSLKRIASSGGGGSSGGDE